MNIELQLPGRKAFQQLVDGKPTDLFILQNENGVTAAITNYGARLVSLFVPDINDNFRDVVVGFDSLKGFLNSSERYYGATIGRCANRISNAKFILEGIEYSLEKNIGDNHLHGGIKGFHNVVWNAEQIDKNSLLLTYLSVDGEEGYPGNLNVELVYSLTNENEIKVAFKGATDKTTIVNLTNHSFFNLNGQGSGSIEKHILEINAEYFTPMDENSIPFGILESVTGTPLDFRNPVTIGGRINDNHIQLQNGKGYDHNFVLNKKPGERLSFTARAIGDESGIMMEVFTQEPGMQLYTGNFMKGQNTIKGGATDDYRSAFCLETQRFPDAANKPAFPSAILEPEGLYQTQTIFKFGIKQ
jgi:aldose 1-epimerase